MKRSEAPKAAPTKTIPVRLQVNEIARIESEAAAAGLSRSGFIAAVLSDREPSPYPALAILGEVIAMRQLVLSTQTITADQIDHLTELVADLARLTSGEVSEL